MANKMVVEVKKESNSAATNATARVKRIVDLKSKFSYLSEEIRFRDISYLVLASTGTLKYRLGEGNKFEWRILAPNLFDYIDNDGKQVSLDDVGIVEPFKTVVLNPRVIENGDESWFCNELLQREIVAKSSPVIVVHPDGFEEQLGTVGFVAEHSSLNLAF